MKTEVIPSFGGQVKFMLQLPPEYQHGRPYPLLLVFPDKDQRPREVLEKMGEIAAKYGYVVAVVDWEGEDYTNSPEAMALVTGLVRHMRRAFQIDSDKVFLMGYGNGATLAMDVAAGHPDLFAGIVPICPTPNHDYLILGKYSTNFQNLPLYMVMGDRAGTEIIRTVRAVYTDWMKLGYPALCVSYKGRGNDHFDEEIPYIFDWMSRKTRVAPVTGVGSDAMPYHTIRTCDNRFFWLSTEEIMKGCQHPLHRKNGSAYMSARLSEGNVISVAPLGLNQVTIWIHRGMVDFNKPVSVRLEQAQREVFRKQLTPKISVLLEDLYERGDRQRPALQRIDIVNINKGVLKVNSP
jgi:pimeloyl-ACP methyl ester carboxylesterase